MSFCRASRARLPAPLIFATVRSSHLRDIDHLEPLPSGILDPLRLISEPDAEHEVNPQ